MKVVTFDLKGDLAHFRRPDTTATHLTYPFITPTAVRGLVGAILGITDFTTNDKVGIQLLNKVITTTQQMSLLGKSGGNVFNRPTTQEILVNPAYRIYYMGNEYTDDLQNYLEKGKSVYHTYLGAAFALTKPLYQGNLQGEPIRNETQVTTSTIVPTQLIDDLNVENDKFYCRASGFLYHYLGERTFDRSIDFIYEQNCSPINFRPKNPDYISELDLDLIRTEAGDVCLF